MRVPFVLAVVSGRSMEPTLRSGDLVLARRGGPLRAGSVVLCDLPPDAHGRPRPRSVKRLTGTDPDDAGRWWVESDNIAAGVSSFDATVGSLAPEAIDARVLLRIRCSRRELPLRRV